MASLSSRARRLLRASAWTVGVIAAGSAAWAETRLDSWSIEDGLPQNSVNDILQTRDGYLWLATFGGLVRFDGVRFVVFDLGVDGVGSIRIRTLHEDRQGTLWAATEDGMLIRHRDGSFRTFTPDDGLPQAVAFRIDEDDGGRLWITWQRWVTRYDGTEFVNFQAGDFPRGVDEHGGTTFHALNRALWWSRDAEGLHCLRAGQVRTCLGPADLPEGELVGVTLDRRGTLWVHTSGAGVLQVGASGRPRLLGVQDGLPTHDADGMFYEDRDGEIWIAQSTGYAYRVAHGRSEPVLRFMFSIFEDREGSIWLGSYVGLHRVRTLTISRVSTRDGLSSDNVYSILRDRAGDLWIGTWGGGLNQYAPGRVRSHGVGHGLPRDEITAVYEDRSRRLWVGTSAGVAYRDGGRFQPYHAPDGWLSGNVWAIHEDASGTFWFATGHGLVRRTPERFVRYTTSDGLANNAISALFEDRRGALWVGTARGLSRLVEGAVTTYTEREGFIGNHVRAFHEDASQVLWVGTYDGGLYRLEHGKLTRYTTREGLHDNGVFQILEDDEGYFWMGSNRGISRVSRRELDDYAAGRVTSVRAVVFGLRDGMATLECNGGRQPAGLRMDDGTLWFPTQGGVAIIDPRAVRTNASRPPVLIEAVHLHGDEVSFRHGVSTGPQQNSFEIRYTALSFVKPEQVRFRYRLVGLDESWVEAGERRTAAFHRVPPGRYEFQVMAANSDGVWSGDSARVSIVVFAPLWRRAWFLAAVAVLLVGALVALDRKRTARQRREHDRQKAYARQLLETLERERRRISTDLHDSLGQSLLLIRAEARSAGDAGPVPARALERISSLAGQASAELKEIAYDLRPYQLDKIGVSRTIQGMLRRINGSYGVEFDFDIADIDDVIPGEAAIGVYRIVQESVSNIVRHSGASRARVAIRRDNGAVEIEVVDNGRGFQPATPAARDAPRTGFGLMGIEERARSLNGRAAVHSTPGHGTTILVRFTPGERTDA